MMLFEESLIFMPSKFPEGSWNPPGLAIEDAWFESDGLKLHGWYVDAEQPRAVVLIAHGNAGNITNRDDLLRQFHALGASVMVFDYRGYGRSEGSPNEAGVLADARSARRWLAKRTEIAEDEIVLCGESLGGGVQVDLAAKDGTRGLILISTFTTRWPAWRRIHYPWFPGAAADAHAARLAVQDCQLSRSTFADPRPTGHDRAAGGSGQATVRRRRRAKGIGGDRARGS